MIWGKRNRMEEKAQQKAYFRMIRQMAPLDRKYRAIWHTPNGIPLKCSEKGPDGKKVWNSNIIVINDLKASGLTPGVYDVTIAIPAQPFHGAFLEFKYGDGSLTEQQKDFRDLMTDLGYLCNEVWTAVDGFNFTQDYIAGKFKRLEVPPCINDWPLNPDDKGAA